MLAADSLTFSYNRRPLLDRITFTVAPGECLVTAGPNGSGKSTLIALLAGILKPQSGSVRTDGRIGYIPQGTALFEDMTVRDNLRFFAGLAKTDVPEELPFGIGAFAGKKVSALSGGMAKRVSIACALLGDPETVLFDEPCSGLDLTVRDEMAALILRLKQEGKTIVYVGHEPSEYSLFYDRLLFLGGRVPMIYTREQLSGTSGIADTEHHKLSSAYRALCRQAEKREEAL